MLSPCTASSHAISVKASRWRTRSDHVTRNALAARNNEVYRQDNGRQSFCTVLRYIKNTGHGNCFTLAVFTLQLEMDYPSDTSPCTVTPSPTDTPSPLLLLRGGGGCTQAIRKWIIHLQLNCPSKLAEKARPIVLIQN